MCGSWALWLTHLSSRVHHLHLLNSNESINMVAFKKVESLRTFLDFGFNLGHVRRLPSIHCLRALRTSSSLLSPLKDLTYLRYLNLHGNSVTSLPNFICGLKKLQILKLEYFGSHNLLPKDLTPLQDLRHLVIYRCPSIADMPLNIGMLSHLRTLSTFIVDSKSGYGLDAKQSNFISKKKLNRWNLSWGNSEGTNVNAELVLETLEPPSTLKSFGMRGY